MSAPAQEASPERKATRFDRHAGLWRALLVLVSAAAVVAAFTVPVFETSPEERALGRRSLRQLLMERLARRVIDDNVGRFLLLREHRPGSVTYDEDRVGRRYRLAADADGYIVPSRVHPGKALTLLFLGGSTTECALMGEEERFPYLVGRKVEAALGRPVNAFNAGVASNESMHSITTLLGKGLRLSPDAVFFLHAINDLMVLLSEGTYWYQGSFKSHLQTSAEVFSRWERPGVRDNSRPRLSRERLADMERRFRANLLTFVGIARANGALPVLMTQENRMEGREELLSVGLGSFNEAIRRVAREEDVLLVDLARDIPREERYIYDAVHFTAEGSRLAAERITGALLEAHRAGRWPTPAR